MLVQQKIALKKSINDTQKIFENNWSIIPLLFVFVFYKIAMMNYNNKLFLLFISIPLFITLLILNFNPIINKLNNNENKLSLKIFIVNLFLIFSINTFFYFNNKNETEEKRKLLVENINYGLLIFNYVIFLIFNVFLKYSGLNILGKYNTNINEEDTSQNTFFIFISIFMIIIFFVSFPRKNIITEYFKNKEYGIFLILPIILLIISYGINIFKNDRTKLFPYAVLCICSFLYILNSIFSLGYNNEILDNINSVNFKNLQNMSSEDNSDDKIKEADKKIREATLLYKKKISGIQIITSKIPILFSLITLLLFLIYSIKIKTNPIIVSLLMIFCFVIYLSFIMGTIYSNYNINNKLKNKDLTIKNFYLNTEETKKSYESLMIAIIVISLLLAFSYGYVNFFSKNIDSKYYILKTVVGFIILAASSFFSYNWGKTVATYNNTLVFDDNNIFTEIKNLNKKYLDNINNLQGEKKNGENIFINEQENSIPIKQFNNDKIILGELLLLKINNFDTINQQSECSINNLKKVSNNEDVRNNYSYQYFIDDITDQNERGVHYINDQNERKDDLYNTPLFNTNKSSCDNISWKKFNDKETQDSFKKNILMKLIDNNNDIYNKYFGYKTKENFDGDTQDEKFENRIKFYKEKNKIMNEMFNKIKNMSLLTLQDIYLPNDQIFSINTDINNTYKLYYNIFSSELLKLNKEVKSGFIDNINNYNNDNNVGQLFNYSNILTVGLLFLGIVLLSNLKFKYDTIYDIFSLTGNSGGNVFNLLYSAFIILVIFSIGIKIESSNKSDLVSEKQIVPSILNSVLSLAYISTLLIPGLINKIAYYVIVLLIHLSMFTIPLNEFKNKLSTNIIFLYVVLMSAIGISVYQVLTPSKNKYSSLYLLLIVCAIFLTLHSAPSIFYLDSEDSDKKNRLFNQDTLEEIRTSSNNSWTVLIFGLVLGFILFSKIINPYNIGKLNLTPSKNFFFAKDNI